MTALFDRRQDATVVALRRQAEVTWRWIYALVILTGGSLAAIAYATAPRMFALAMTVLVAGAVAILVRPAVGVYLIAFFGALGDGTTAAWYPFVKNLSSRESTLFVASAVSVSPAEIYLALTALSWVLVMAGRREWRLVRGQPFLPLVAFLGFVLLAGARGIAQGGDVKVALFEIRPLVLLGGLYVLAVNLLTTRRQWRGLVWLLMVALTVNAYFSIGFLSSLTKLERDGLESLVDHSAAVQMNAMFVLVIAAWVYRGGSPARRWLLPLMAAPVAYVYLVSQRRAAVVGLVAVALMAAILMFWNHRRRFWQIIPLVLAFAAVYVVAFWNVERGPGFPAQAVKSVVAPEQLSTADQSSDIYRTLENVDLLTTIKAKPLLGIGYGQQFYRPIALPDISTFEYWQYIPHNSILSIWMKTGIFGFLSMLALFGVGLRTGAHALRRARGDDAAMTFTAVAFIVMYGLYAYVDIAWDSRSMIYLALSLALIVTVHRTGEPAAESTLA
jgi:O-antigen ligase